MCHVSWKMKKYVMSYLMTSLQICREYEILFLVCVPSPAFPPLSASPARPELLEIEWSLPLTPFPVHQSDLKTLPLTFQSHQYQPCGWPHWVSYFCQSLSTYSVVFAWLPADLFILRPGWQHILPPSPSHRQRRQQQRGNTSQQSWQDKERTHTHLLPMEPHWGVQAKLQYTHMRPPPQ